jgi:hypothetical protein
VYISKLSPQRTDHNQTEANLACLLPCIEGLRKPPHLCGSGFMIAGPM